MQILISPELEARYVDAKPGDMFTFVFDPKLGLVFKQVVRIEQPSEADGRRDWTGCCC